MATVTELVTRLKARLARRSLTTIDAILLDEMTHTQVEILEAAEWLPYFLKYFAGITITGAHFRLELSVPTTAQVTIPTGFIRLLTEEDRAALTYLNNEGYHIKIPRYDSFQQMNQILGSGPDTGTFPAGYYWEGRVGFDLTAPPGFGAALQLRPTTLGSVTYQISYYRHDPNTPLAPDASGNTLWTRFAGDYLMHTTGVEVATDLRDKEALGYFVGKRQEAYDRLRKQKTAMDMADTDLVMGD